MRWLQDLMAKFYGDTVFLVNWTPPFEYALGGSTDPAKCAVFNVKEDALAFARRKAGDVEYPVLVTVAIVPRDVPKDPGGVLKSGLTREGYRVLPEGRIEDIGR